MWSAGETQKRDAEGQKPTWVQGGERHKGEKEGEKIGTHCSHPKSELSRGRPLNQSSGPITGFVLTPRTREWDWNDGTIREDMVEMVCGV